MIEEQGSWEQLRSAGGYVQGISKGSKELRNKREEQAPPQTFQAPISMESANTAAAADLSRKTGDWQVYRYWLRSLGVTSVVFFIMGLVVLVFFWKFPGISPRFGPLGLTNCLCRTVGQILDVGCCETR